MKFDEGIKKTATLKLEKEETFLFFTEAKLGEKIKKTHTRKVGLVFKRDITTEKDTGHISVVADGIIALTNKNIIYLKKTGSILKHTFIKDFMIPLENIESISEVGLISKWVTISTSDTLFPFKVEEARLFQDKLQQITNKQP